ncbi:heme uptake protein IsdC [Cohnella hashimotonis]|uniref:Heme uptake protein IsdC n=1 Tax=Cohnella hashimotonis TaxID=2826895 RepID=A0ABT6TJE8_9BACL|nr:heme uptake protein IsdC [Cohnella hashimotonis]MDI4646972.1 heme uptake protein IsdC [Cohnella hashimotonis]
MKSRMKKKAAWIWVVALLLTLSLPFSGDIAQAAQADGAYTIDYQILQAENDSVSMANDYWEKPATVVIDNGNVQIQMTINHSQWVTAFKVPGSGGGYINTRILSKDAKADTRKVVFAVSELPSSPMLSKIHVTVPDIDYDHDYTIRFDFKADSLKLVKEGAGKPAASTPAATAKPKPQASAAATAKPQASAAATAMPQASAAATAKPQASAAATAKPQASVAATAKPQASEAATAKPQSSEAATAKPQASAAATASASQEANAVSGGEQASPAEPSASAGTASGSDSDAESPLAEPSAGVSAQAADVEDADAAAADAGDSAAVSAQAGASAETAAGEATGAQPLASAKKESNGLIIGLAALIVVFAAGGVWWWRSSRLQKR